MATTDLPVERILSDLKRLRSARPAPEIFGAESHEFKVNPALDEVSVAAFETENRIRLPADYRVFLTAIGNGGAGPYRGVFPLGKMDGTAVAFVDWKSGDDHVGVLAEPFPHRRAWNDRDGEPPQELYALDEAEYGKRLHVFEARYFDSALMNGAIPICHFGCAVRFWLVVTGDEAGHIWWDDRASDNGIGPYELPGMNRVNFARWYLHWLDEAVAKIPRSQPSLLNRLLNICK